MVVGWCFSWCPNIGYCTLFTWGVYDASTTVAGYSFEGIMHLGVWGNVHWGLAGGGKPHKAEAVTVNIGFQKFST